MQKKEFYYEIETERLIITEFTMDMAESVHLNSLGGNNRRFVPNEAVDNIEFLMNCY